MSFRWPLIGAVFGAVAVAAYFVIGKTIGFSGPAAHWQQYGEIPVDGLIRQPICFWSDIGFIVAGVAVLRRPSPPPLIGLGLLIVWMGPASMFEHGTLLTNWGWLDATSIHWFALFTIGALIRRPAAWAALAVAAVAIGAWTFTHERHRQAFTMALLSASIVTALLALLIRKPGRAVWLHFAVTIALFAVAAVFLATGAAGGLTAPFGHGAWHVFSAIAMYFAAGMVRAIDV